MRSSLDLIYIFLKKWWHTNPIWCSKVMGNGKAPVNTKFILMNCSIGNTNYLRSSSSGLGYYSFYINPTDGATKYSKLGSGSGSGRIQTDYWVKLREKDKKLLYLQWDLNSQTLVHESNTLPTELSGQFMKDGN